LENAWLNGADWRSANLSGVCLRGARLREAMLEYADLSGADLSYCDLRGARLENANLVGTILYPAEAIGAKIYGAKFAPGSDAAEYVRIGCEEMIKKMRIHPNSVMYRKLQQINGWTSSAPRDGRYGLPSLNFLSSGERS
jgi:Pentapeptide repeats (8 copies)